MTLTIRDAIQYIDRQALLHVEDLQVPVIIHDVRQVYGNVRFEITPVGGIGRKWVNADRVQISADR